MALEKFPLFEQLTIRQIARKLVNDLHAADEAEQAEIMEKVIVDFMFFIGAERNWARLILNDALVAEEEEVEFPEMPAPLCVAVPHAGTYIDDGRGGNAL